MQVLCAKSPNADPVEINTTDPPTHHSSPSPPFCRKLTVRMRRYPVRCHQYPHKINEEGYPVNTMKRPCYKTVLSMRAGSLRQHRKFSTAHTTHPVSPNAPGLASLAEHRSENIRAHGGGKTYKEAATSYSCPQPATYGCLRTSP